MARSYPNLIEEGADAENFLWDLAWIAGLTIFTVGVASIATNYFPLHTQPTPQ